MAEELPQNSPNLWTTGWSLLSGCFRIALMPGKVMLAALGVFAMALGWWFLALIFASTTGTSPEWPGSFVPTTRTSEEKKPVEGKAKGELVENPKAAEEAYEAERKKGWKLFKEEQTAWNLMYETAGMGKAGQFYSVEDVAQTPEELDLLKAAGLLSASVSKTEPGSAKVEPEMIQQGRDLSETLERALRDGKLKGISEDRVAQIRAFLGKPKPAGRLNTWPWNENRGPNSLMLVSGTSSLNSNRFLDWLIKDQGPVLIEPVLKMLRPVAYLFHPKASTGQKIYFLMVALWTILVWSIFGGAISRMAGMELARDESIPMREALEFSLKRLQALAVAPLAPLLLMLALLILISVFGIIFMIPIVGDILLGGLGWIVPLLVGFGMAILLVGLLSWPLMIATVAVDSEDFVQATSRGVSYLYQRPRGIALYALKALLFGAASIFVVGFMSSLTVYLAKWSVSQTPGIHLAGREPDFLFVHAPITFGWRELLLDGTTVNGSPIVVDGKVDALQLAKYKQGFAWWNHTGAFLASGWLYAALLLVLGFGYSFFWSASTALYIALRQDIESFDVNEIYLDEPDAEPETVPAPTVVPAPAPLAKPNTNGGVSLSVVEPPPSSPPGGG